MTCSFAHGAPGFIVSCVDESQDLPSAATHLSIKTNAAAEYHWHCRTRTLEGHADSRRLICVTCPVPLCNLAIASRASSVSAGEACI